MACHFFGEPYKFVPAIYYFLTCHLGDSNFLLLMKSYFVFLTTSILRAFNPSLLLPKYVSAC